MAFLPLSYVNGMYSTLDTVRAKFILCFQNMSDGGNALIGGNVPIAGQFIANAAVYGLQANAALTWSPANNNFRYWNNLAMTWIRANLDSAAGGAVTLQAINDAMEVGTYSEINDNLTLQWVFQQIMWDQPFFPVRYTELLNRVRT